MKNIIRYTIHIIMIFLSSPCVLHAQSVFKIEGKVTTMEAQETGKRPVNEPLIGVNVALLQNDSSFVAGSVSNEKGIFQIANISKGDYILKLSYMGYETVWIAIKDLRKDIKTGEIQLHGNSMELAEVTISGNPIVRQVDRMIVYPTENALKHSYDPYDVIGHMMIPRLRVNKIKKNLEADGGKEVQIRINGIKASQAEMQAIPAKDVVRVEVIDNPGMRYGEEVLGAVVNVIVKHRTTGGLVSLGAESCPYRLIGGANFSTKLNVKRSQWGLNYTNTLRNITPIQVDRDERFILGENNDIHRIQEGISGRTNTLFHNADLTYNYSDPDNCMVNIAFRNNIQDTPHRNLFNKLYAAGGNEAIFSRKTADSWSYIPSLDILFEKTLKRKQKLLFNVIGSLIRSRSHGLYREYEDSQADLTHIQSDAESSKQSVWGEAIYDKTYKNTTLSTGVRHYQTHAHTRYKGTNPGESSMNQLNTSVFLDLQGRIKSVGYLISVGGLRSYFKESDQGHSYYLFTPTVRINFVPHKNGWMQYSLNCGSTIPSLGSLTGIEQLVDSIQIQRGNPHLKTYRTYTNTLMYTYNKPQFAGILQFSHSYYDNPVMEEYFSENNKLIRTERNQDYFQKFAINTTGIIRNIKLWGLTMNAEAQVGYTRFWSKGNLYNHVYSQVFFRWQWAIGYKEFMFFFEGMTNPKSLWGETITKGENKIDCGIMYTRKRFQALAAIMSPFVNNYKVGSERISAIAPFTERGYSKMMGNLVTISIRYNFAFGKKFEKIDKRSRYKDTDSGILKGY